jgi:excisionase family DNA binding protein
VAANRMYSLEQVAERLGLNVRTVRSYVRSGRLKAVRIGKQYRVARECLEALAGPLSEEEGVPRHRHAEAACVVQIDAVSSDHAKRIANRLIDAAQAPRGDGSPPRIETVYDDERARMKVVVIGSLPATADLFRLLGVILETA